MINGFDEEEHKLVPMLKLIDFGMARDRSEMDTGKMYAHWSSLVGYYHAKRFLD